MNPRWGIDSVEPTLERSEVSKASILWTPFALLARPSSAECRPTNQWFMGQGAMKVRGSLSP
jgi:hypothetical protein